MCLTLSVTLHRHWTNLFRSYICTKEVPRIISNQPKGNQKFKELTKTFMPESRYVIAFSYQTHSFSNQNCVVKDLKKIHVFITFLDLTIPLLLNTISWQVITTLRAKDECTSWENQAYLPIYT